MMNIRPSQRYRGQLAQHTDELLTNLGDDAPAVARALGSIGVSGVPRAPRECAVACYLSAVVGSERAVQSVHVGKDELGIRLAGWRPAVRVALPRAVREFIAAFDSNLFPELISKDDATRPPPLPTGAEGLSSWNPWY